MLSNTDYRYMSLAMEEAKKSQINYQVGCIAVVSGKIVARGCNTYRTYSKRRNDWSCLFMSCRDKCSTKMS